MQSIKKNYIYSVIYQILAILIPLVTVPYLTRIIGAEGLGTFSYTNAVAYYFVLLSMLGINNYGNRMIASCRDDKSALNRVFSELVIMQISFGLMVLGIYAIYVVFLFILNRDIFVESSIWALYILSAVIDISWFYWGIEKFSITVIRNAIIKIITTICIFVFIKSQKDLLIYIIIMASSSLLASVILWSQLKGIVSLQKVGFKQAYSHIRGNIILFIPVIAVSIYTVMDKIMLGALCPMQELGYYDSIQKIMTLPTGIITALGTVMLPRISNLVAKGQKHLALSLITRSMQFSNFLSIALAFGLCSIAPCFTLVYFGNEFSNTSRIMELFSVTIIFISWANVIRTQYLIPVNKDNVYIISVIVGAIINVVVNWALIPRLMAIGAVIGTIFAETSVAAIQTISIRKELPIKRFIKDAIKFIFPGGIMFIIVRLIYLHIGNSVCSLVLQIGIGALVYLLLACVIIFYTKMDLGQELKNNLSRNQL